MSNNSDVVFPAAARRAQAERGSAHAYEKRIAAGFPDRVTPELAAFIAELDTAFLATVSSAARLISNTAAARRASSKCWTRRRSPSPITPGIASTSR